MALFMVQNGFSEQDIYERGDSIDFPEPTINEDIDANPEHEKMIRESRTQYKQGLGMSTKEFLKSEQRNSNLFAYGRSGTSLPVQHYITPVQNTRVKDG
jgi:hypothetical protein